MMTDCISDPLPPALCTTLHYFSSALFETSEAIFWKVYEYLRPRREQSRGNSAVFDFSLTLPTTLEHDLDDLVVLFLGFDS